MAERINRKVGGSTSTISDTSPGVGGGTTTADAFNQMITDASSFSLTLDSGTRNAIQWIAAKKHILIGTTGGEWRMGGHSNKPFTLNNFDLKQQTNRGSKDIQPILISDAIAFVNEVGRKLHKFTFDGISEDYDTPDLSVLAEHITASGIITMAFQRNPDEILWLTLVDGTLLSMTYDPEQNVIAWARHPMSPGEIPAVPLVPEVPAVTDTYTQTFLSENGDIWGVPLEDGALSVRLSGSATDLGGGDVALTTSGSPFTSGMVIRIEGSTSYDGDRTLIAGTSATSLRFTVAFNAETFDGTETVVRHVSSLPASLGRMALDVNGNLWYGHNATSNKIVTKIAPDGTETTSDLNGLFGGTCYGVFPSVDGNSLYIKPGLDAIWKYDLGTGDQDWAVSESNGGYQAAIDADENVYNGSGGTGNDAWEVTSAGVKTTLTGFGSIDAPQPQAFNATLYAMHVDDDMGVLVGGGLQRNLSTSSGDLLYNLVARSLTGTTNAKLALGGFVTGGGVNVTYTIGSGNIQTFNSLIYVLSYTPDPTLYQIQWANDTLTVLNSQVIDTNAAGFYFDLYGNLVVIAASTDTANRLWIYDTNFALVTKISNLWTGMVSKWGGTWIQGNEAFDGVLGVAAIPAVPAVAAISTPGTLDSVAVIPGTGEDEVWVAVGRIVNGSLVRSIERMKPRDWGDDMEDMFFVDSGLTYDSTATTTITGLSHLEGETVAILGDGAVLPTQVVSSGAITLSESVSVAQVGLPFTYKLKPMRMDQNTRKGTSKGSIGKFAEAVISFYKTLNAKFGDGTTTYKIPWRGSSDDYSDPPALFTGDKVVVADGGFSVEDPFQIEGDDPMPCSVRAIIPRKETPGR